MYMISALGVAKTDVTSAMTSSMSLNKRVGQVRSTEVSDKLIDSWDEHDASGYDASRDCFYWGHRPAVPRIIGVHLSGTYWNGFWICPYGSCPPAKACPKPIACPPCSTGPMPAPPGSTADTSSGKLFGVNIGLLVAGSLTAGVGYYGYKKGWFKALKRRK